LNKSRRGAQRCADLVVQINADRSFGFNPRLSAAIDSGEFFTKLQTVLKKAENRFLTVAAQNRH